ncbi:hypothetical protein ACH4D5_16790 [Streptomyces sp. NPDC018029]|uniref:hypothetical protein n=1 Tax=Streptomyces sp. NPDC018029 TaxID=3365032 RepID=UPI00378824D5
MESNVQARMKLRELVSHYASRGYSVVPVKDLPEGIAALQPDLVVSKGDENIVIELKGGNQPSGSAHAVQLERMAEALEGLGRWKLELHWLGAPPAERLPRDQIADILSRALAVRQVDASAALLLAWAAAEVALDRMIRRQESSDANSSSDPFSRRTPRQMVSLAQSLGLIPEDVYDVLLRTGDARNRIAHGFSMEGILGVDDLADELLDTVRRIAPESYVSPDQMIDWFHDHYGDPVRDVPDPGPDRWPAQLLLAEHFVDSDDRDIAEAARILDRESDEWVEIKPIR